VCRDRISSWWLKQSLFSETYCGRRSPSGTHLGMQTLTIQLFGAFALERDGQPLPPTRTRKEQWLLALLLLRHPRQVERSWLAATLWPDSADSQARENLRHSLTNLRSILGPDASRLVAETSRTLHFDASGTQTDLLAFDAAMASGDPARWEEAVALHRGPLLEGCEEEWIVGERVLREEAYRRALEGLAQHAEKLGARERAISLLRRLLVADPLRESGVRSLMRLLAEKGEHAEVTQVYRDFRLLVHDQLRGQPDAETTGLYRLLRAEARETAQASPLPLASSAPARRRLPTPLTSFIGRHAEREKLLTLLETTRLLTLTGTGGVGKTRLAIALAEEIADEFGEGVCFVDLAPLQDPARVVQAVAQALEMREEPQRALSETLAEHLEKRSLLLILDNCEHLTAPCAALAQALLVRCPHLHLLATSRQPLGADGERTWAVPSLSLPEGGEQDWADEKGAQTVLMGSEAVRLFVERAALAYPPFRLTRENMGDVAEICVLLEGIPLALELAAAWVRVLSAAQLVSRLRDRLDLLQSRHAGPVARHQTLRATMDWSYELLEAGEQRLLQHLSVFAGGWTLEAAEAVCVRPQEPAEGVLLGLARLADHSLVDYQDRAEVGRYRLLETVRLYAREKLLETGEAEAIRGRHRDFFLALAEEASPELTGADQVTWISRLEVEHENLRAGLDWSLSVAEATEGLRWCGALQQFWWTRGYLSEGRAWCLRALEMTDAQLRTYERAKTLNGAGILATRQGDYPSARAYHEESLNILREIGDRRGIALLLNNLGSVIFSLCDFPSARANFEESLSIQREIGDLWGATLSLNNLGAVALAQGDYSSARIYHEESLRIRKDLSDQWGIAYSFFNLGLVSCRQGDYTASKAYYEESLSIRREIGDTMGIGYSLSGMGSVALLQGDLASAQAHHQESLNIRKKIGDREGIAVALNDLGSVASLQGDSAAARTYIVEALDIYRKVGNTYGVANALLAMGNVAFAQGDYAAAQTYYEEGLSICREIGDRNGIADALLSLGNVAFAQGDYATAKANYAEILPTYREIGNRHSLAQTFGGFASLAEVESQPERLAALLGAVVALREEIGAPISPEEQERFDMALAAARQTLGEEIFSAASAKGRAMPLDEAVAYALRSGEA